MGLDDLINDDSSTDTPTKDASSVEYVTITRDTFEAFLADTQYQWELIEGDEETRFSDELVYTSNDLGFPLYPDLKARLYSSIEQDSGQSRGKGQDSIKTLIWSTSLDRPIGGRAYTKRISTWPANLTPKIRSIMEEVDEYVTECEECGGWLVERENSESGNKFLGCSSYPDCKNTAAIED